MTTWAFYCCFFGIALWEGFSPRVHNSAPFRSRWITNISLGTANLVLFGSLLSLSEIVRPDWIPPAAESAWQWIGKVPALAFAVAFLLLDFFNYWMHRLFHAVPALWRLHAIHHADPDLDVSTGVRHHPLENLASLLLTLVLAVTLGVPLSAIGIYGVVNAAIACIHHGNIALPAWAEKAVGKVLVTPNVHRIHHSVVVPESNLNFGGVFSVWDRLFGTFASKSALEHSDLYFGLLEFSGVRYCQLHRVLGMPFSAWPKSVAA
ncbi:MAG TPA: sterol desaturase family protein [Stellaceae bacterium]|nr:sterol desaturase family protein [Stellaceae bacterium]